MDKASWARHPALMNLIHNERMKLLATGLNNLAVATLVAGILAPIAGVLYGTSSASGNRGWLLVTLIWLCAGFGLHVLGRIVLGRLRE